jgi:transposase-like protein
MSGRDACPACQAQPFKKNGHIHTGKQPHRCQDCGWQCVLHAANRVIDEEHRPRVARIWVEKISLHGRCRAVRLDPAGVSCVRGHY